MTGTKSAVWITGMGIVSRSGIGPEAFWGSFSPERDRQTNSLLGRDGNMTTGPRFYSEKETHRFDRSSELAVSASKMALINSRLDLGEVKESSVGVCFGSAWSVADSMSGFMESVLVNGPRRCDVGLFPSTIMSAPASRVSILESIKGLSTTICSGRNSGIDSVGYSFYELMFNPNRLAMIAGGVESFPEKIVKAMGDKGFILFGKESNLPKSLAFDITDGAAAIVLERAEKGHAKIESFGSAFFPHKRSSRNDRLTFFKKLLLETLSKNEIPVSDINGIIISSFFDKEDLQLEVDGVSQVFKGKNIPIYSLKSFVGEGFGLSGVQQVILGVGILQGDVSLEDLALSNLRAGPESLTPKALERILLTSVDSSGHMSCLVVSKSRE